MARPHLGPHGTNRVLVIFLVLFGASILGLVPEARAVGPLPNCFVSGPIAVDTAWAPVCIRVMIGNVTVMPSVTLTIQPGVTVRAEPYVTLSVRGRLFADGTSAMNITFEHNRTTAASPWGGIQFNPNSTGSVSWSVFSRADRAVTVFGSSPPIRNNTILQAGVGFAFLQNSASTVFGNTIRRATSFGIYVNGSTVQILDNLINNTQAGIQVEQPSFGATWISGNTITNVSSGLAAGILISKASADVTSNAIRGVRGAAGGNGATPGSNGRDGGIALGVYANTPAPVSVIDNTIDVVLGGNGGNGHDNVTGTGGRGGNGGPAAGIVVAGTSNPVVQGNSVSNVAGGRGGAGGGGGGTVTGGRGGNAGEGAGIEVAFTTGGASVTSNSLSRVTGGGGGTGGQGAAGGDGSGGLGANGYGLFLISVAVSDASGNTIDTVRGGFGGNTSASLNPTGNGAGGGDAIGISGFSVVNAATVHFNGVDTLTGGLGGRGRTGGHGGNATGVIVLGNNDGRFNLTTVSSNTITSVMAGNGGDGSLTGGDGGSATGIGAVYVTPSLAGNSIQTVQGGNGDTATTAGRGGDAAGVIGGLVRDGWSSDEWIEGVAKGSPGTGGAPKPATASGYYLVGNATFTSRFTVENGTLLAVGSFDFYVDNYTEAVALNTPFTTVSVHSAGNLTVQNFLEIQVAWPNAATPVAGARIQVQDNTATIWNRIAPSGDQSWILVTDRVYVNSNTAVENKTTVTVTYGSYAFTNSPRAIPMDTSHTETVVMRDQSAPTSAASALPTYENTFTFFVRYTANDGNGTGFGNITLWYRMVGSGSGGWTPYLTQPAGTEGRFTFIATRDGFYEFATTAQDAKGNSQPDPTQNNTWTIVDTTRPGSHVVPLPGYETSLSFVVTWAPDVGVTDIATYRVEYYMGGAWLPWLASTSSTSATFTAPAEGVYAFRAIATDRAGNVEATPSGNDTWTLIDATVPSVITSTPQGNNTQQTPIIEIAFSEAMDRASVEQAFSLTSGSSPVTGTFLWSADLHVVKFLPGAPLAAGTTFTVIVGTGASDRAGNRVQNPLTFQFTTVPAAATGLSLGDFWWLLPIVGAVLAGGLFLFLRQRAAAAKPVVAPPAPSKGSEAIIEDVFLLYHRDGILIKHETRRLRPDVDTDILTGMLTAVQQFVKDALRGDEYADLNEMTVGHMHILIGRGKWLVLAARIEGDGVGSWTGRIERCIKDMEDHHWDQLEDWDGDMALARVLMPYLKKLILGGYTLVEA
jgi:hypothetical protein